MVKNLNQRKNHKKSSIKRRFRKIIKFIRHVNKKEKLNISTSQKSDSTAEKSTMDKKESHIELSLINWTFIFLQKNSCPMIKNNKFIQEFINIIRKLCFNKNEFILWTLYIEHYIGCDLNYSWDIETLFYIAKYVKKQLGKKNDGKSNININKDKYVEIKSILGKKTFNLIELNQKYNYYSNFTNQKKNNYYDFNSMVEYIYNSNNYKNVKKNDNKLDGKQQNDNTIIDNVKKTNSNNDRYLIPNQLILFNPNEINSNSIEEKNQDNNSNNWNNDRVYEYDNAQLKDEEGEGYMKLDSSNDNFNMTDMNFDGLFYIYNK